MIIPLTPDNIHNAITAALNELQCGCSTVGEIAERLRINNCAGSVNWPATMTCPVGQWLLQRLPWQAAKGFCFGVSQGGIYVDGQHIPVPTLIGQFIVDFDRHLYPQLDKRELHYRGVIL